jgi:type VII secretion integral membrane protein EccD
MTAPSSRPELDAEPDDELELSRITALVGELLIDVGVPSRVSISAVVFDVIELANEQLSARTDRHDEFENTEGRWTFARLSGSTIDPDRSLAEAGVYDGELLLVHEVGASESSVLVDEVEGIAESYDRRAAWFSEHGWMTAWFAISIALSAATALLLPKVAVASLAGMPIAAMAVLVVGVGCAATACVMPYRSSDPRTAAWLAGVALPLIFGGSMTIVPDGHGVTALPMALALTALVALLQLLITGRGRPLYTTVIAVALVGAPAAIAYAGLNLSSRAVGAIVATTAVIVVYLAPRVTILLSSLPVPRVPTAGEPLDDIETQGGTAVDGVNAIGKQVIPTEEGMTDRVWRATEYLTGIVAAAAIVAVAGCYLTVGAGDDFYWQGTAFAFAVATVLCLRGRSHHDLVQSATLISGGLIIPLVVIVKTATFVSGWQVNAAIALVALTAVVALCGMVAPTLDFSPVMRRRVEVIEVIAIALVFPLACWIIGIYTFLRELQV